MVLRNARQGQEHVYWPSMNNSIEQEIKTCSICNAYSRANRKEPLLSHSVPLRPWDKVGADHFTFAAADYLIASGRLFF